MRQQAIGLVASGAVTFAAGVAAAAPVFQQGFETDASGWYANNSPVIRVASGTNGITSASGSFHATVGGGAPTGAYTKFGGYRSTFGAGFTAQVAVYLDTGMADGSGFDYSVAASQQDGNFLRDFIFHVAKDSSTGKLLVAGDNNTNFATREDLENLPNHYEVTQSGWYTFQSVFYDNAGALAVDLNLLNAGGTTLFTETRTNPADLIASVVGGNRYGWFTFVDAEGGIAIDDTTLDLAVVPLPTGAGMAGLGLLALGARRRRSAL